MIFDVFSTSLRGFMRDRGAMALSFLLPIVFFSIFAAILVGSGKARPMPAVKVAIADLDGTAASRALASALAGESALSVVPPEEGSVWTAESAEAAVRSQTVPAALIIPRGFGEAGISFSEEGSAKASVSLLADSSNPVAAQMVSGLLQKAFMTSSPSRLAVAGMSEIDKWSGGFSAEQKSELEKNLAWLESQEGGVEGAPAGSGSLLTVTVRDLMGETKESPAAAFYASALGVMFVLFTAAGAGGVLLEEAESGTLDRVLSTRVGMGPLLAGKLLFMCLLAATQITLMFLWGALVFRVELFAHLGGFAIMALVTSLAGAAFGLMLAAVCRSRAQLGALSTIVILVISALGGSMFPRFLMPEGVQKWSLIAFNSWALDGFLKVFWRDEPLLNLWPQVIALLLFAAAFFAVARIAARKWETA